MDIIITAPSLDPRQNVSGVSSVVKFIIDNNKAHHYIHFELGKKDKERGGVFRLFPLLKAIERWRQLLGQHPNALVHYNFPLSAASVIRDPLFMWMARRRGMKMIVHVHGGLYLTADKIPWLQRCILKRVFKMQVPFVALSEAEVDIIKRKFGAKDVSSLPNCIELQEAKDFCREENQGTLHIGYLGRIAKTKGMDDLLEACRKLKEEGMEFVLEIAGKEEHEGEYLPQFRALLDKDFHYAGIVSGKSKSDFLRALDIFVLPSHFEGLPMSLLESMSYGIVPVTTPVGSIPHYISESVNGLFMKMKDAKSLCQQIMRLNEDRKMLHQLSISAKQTIFNSFSPDLYVQKLNGLYQNVIEKGV